MAYHYYVTRSEPVQKGKGQRRIKGGNERCKRRMQGLAVQTYAGRLLPVRRLKKDMKIVVQNRKTNAFLTQDAKWVQRFESARQFTTSLEALRFCADRQLRETDMVVCFPGARSNMRVPLI